ncbi:MAG: HAD-IIIA family hydrolase [Bacteroidota bacterium]
MFLNEIDSSWTLFLDRDGVINERKMGGYVQTVEEFKFLPKVEESIAYFTTIFQHIFVVTNQQGIGKGIMTECNLIDIHRYMCEKIEEKGGKISQCYFAPELKSLENSMRKPNSGMALLAKKDFPTINFEKAVMVGDTDSDILFGKNLGMKTVRIKTIEEINVEADLTVDSLDKLKEIWEKRV